MTGSNLSNKRSLFVLALLLALASLLPGRSGAQTVSDIVYSPVTGHWYEAISVPGGITWNAARTAAEGRSHEGFQGHLATLTTAEECNWVNTNLPLAFENQFWLGGYQPTGSSEPFGGWRWVTEEPWHHTRWSQSRPFNSTANNVLALTTQGRWQDSSNTGNHAGYVVEYGNSAPPTPLITFSLPEDYPIFHPQELFTADFDQDGHLDLAICSTMDVGIMYGMGDGTFELPIYMGLDTNTVAAAAGDVDGDGDTDLIVSGQQSLYIIRRIAPRTYALPQRTEFTDRSIYWVLSRDLNKDGIDDIVFGLSAVGPIPPQVVTWRGQAGGPVAASTTKYSSARRLVPYDGDRDGLTDLLTCEGPAEFLHGQGLGFQEPLPPNGSGPNDLAATDWDGDGRIDTLSARGNEVFLSRTAGSDATYPATPSPYNIDTADLDNDGDPDAITSDSGGTSFSVYRNTGAIASVALDFTTTGSNSRYLTTGDYNEDGRVDVVVGHDPTNNLSVFLNTTDFPAPAPEVGLVSWWKAEGNASDSMGRNHGVSASATYTNGVIGQAFFFNGTTAGVNVRDSATLRLSENLSIAAWIHVLSLPAAGKERTIFFRGDDRVGMDPYRLSVRSNGTLGFTLTARDGATHTLATPPIEVGKWMHVAATLEDESDAVVLYINGQQVAQNTTNVRPYRTLDHAYTPGVGIGNVQQAPNPYFDGGFHGRIDELQLYDYALSASEVAGLVDPFPSGPLAPANLTAGAVSESEIQLNWQDKSTNELTFEVWRAITGGPFEPVAATATNITAYRADGLVPNTSYTFKVRAVNEFGESAFTNEATAKTHIPTGPPPAPSNLQVSALSATELQVSWQDNSLNEEVFELERKTGAGAFALVASPGPNTTAYRDTGLGTSTTYTYRVRAKNSFGPSAYSAEASGTTSPPPSPPQAPNNLVAAAVSATELQLTWQDNSTTEASFELERKLVGGSFSPLVTLEANITTYRNTGLSANTTYIYRVRARNVLGPSAYSADGTGITLPVPPSAFAVSRISESRLDLNWTNGNPSPAAHRVERSLNGSTGFTEIASLTAGTSTYSNTGLEADREYFYRIRAVNASGFSVYSAVQSGRTLPVPPGRPTNLAAALLPSLAVRLTWVLAAGGTPQGIKVERSENSGGNFTQVGIATGAVTSYDDTSAQPDRAYLYRVRAYNDGGHSLYTLPVNINTPPAAPTALTLMPQANGSIALQWQDNSSTETNFRIERKTGNGAFGLLTQVGANVQTHTDASVAGNTSYTYRVRALGPNSLESGWSNEASTSAQPLAPTNLTAQATSSSQIQLNWTDANGTAVQHRVERSSDGGQNYSLVTTTAAGVTTLQDGGRSANTRYHYRVRAEAGMTASSYSTAVSAVTFPAAPSALAVVAQSVSSLRLTWTDNNPTPAPHRVERSLTGSEPFETLELVPAGTTSWDNTGLSANSTYHYRVLAQNGSGVSSALGPVSGTTLPAQPTALTAAGISQTRIRVTWSDANPVPAEHKVERSADGGNNYTQFAVVAAGTTQWEQDVTANPSPYLYRVRASNASGHSAFAGPVSASPLPPAPSAPTGLVAIFTGASQVTVRWNDTSSSETGFELERRTRTGTFTRIAQPGINATTYQDTVPGVEPAFIYRVRALNAGGASAYTAEVEAVRPSGGKLVVTPLKLNYGNIRHRRVVKKTVTIRNTGRGDLGVNVGVLNAPFRITSGSGSFLLLRRKTQKVTFEFTPTVPGKFTATLVITSTDPAKPTVSVSHTATVR